MAIPTWEEYQEQNPEATWAEYVGRFSAMAAHQQVEAGEIPSDYGASHSFTPAGVWVKSGSPAAIGGLPAEITTMFPAVEESYQEAYKAAVEPSIITTSRAGEPQIQQTEPPGIDRSVSEYGYSLTFDRGGGTAPIEFNEAPGPSQTFGITPIPESGQFQIDYGGPKGPPGGNGDVGAAPLLLLLAMAMM